jgi:hypothetical protein
MTAFPDMIRNVAVVGHLHHGKTALMDMLVFETHKMTWDADHPVSRLFHSFSGANRVHRRVIPILMSWLVNERSP